MSEEEADGFDIGDEYENSDMSNSWGRADEAIRTGNDAALCRALADCPGIVRNFCISESLLTEAAELGRVGAIAALLDAGVSPNLINGSGGTPLIAAASNGHFDAARLLLDAGADPDILVEDHCDGGDPDVVGRCALFFALAKGHRDLVNLLEPVTHPDVRDLAHRELPAYLKWLEENPPPHVPTVELYAAIKNGRPDHLAEAIAAGGNVNNVMPAEASQPARGGTPLSHAAAAGRMDLVESLLQAGADPGLQSTSGRVPADFADLYGHSEVAEALRAAARLPRAD